MPSREARFEPDEAVAVMVLAAPPRASGRDRRRADGVAVGVAMHLGQLDGVGAMARTERRSRRRRSPRPGTSPASASASFGGRARSRRPRPASRDRGSGRCGGGRAASPGRLSNVRRPMIIALPMVSRLKRFRSSGMCQGSLPSLPITPLSARATTRVMTGDMRSGIAGRGHSTRWSVGDRDFSGGRARAAAGARFSLPREPRRGAFTARRDARPADRLCRGPVSRRGRRTMAARVDPRARRAD